MTRRHRMPPTEIDRTARMVGIVLIAAAGFWCTLFAALLWWRFM